MTIQETKLVLIIDNITKQNPKEPSDKFLAQEFIKFAGYLFMIETNFTL